jgi:hypothetical protein
MSLLLIAGNLLGTAGPFDAIFKSFEENSCLPSGYYETDNEVRNYGGQVVSMAAPKPRYRVSTPSPVYLQYRDCMVKKGQKPLDQIWH